MATPAANMQYAALWVEWWHENQVVLTFHSPEPLEAGASRIIDSLNLDELNTFLTEHNYQLKPFTRQDVPRSHRRDDDDDRGEREDEYAASTPSSQDIAAQSRGADSKSNTRQLKNRRGKYFFRSPSSAGTSVIAFFHFENTSKAAAPVMESTDGDMPSRDDDTLGIVTLVNRNRGVIQERHIPPLSAMPNWLNGGAPFGCGTHGCPVSPPLPVPDSCSVDPGYWPFAITGNIPEASNTDLTVFVLDTLPKANQLRNASDAANQNGAAQNLLLSDMVTGMAEQSPFDAIPPAINVNYTQLPDILDIPNPMQPATGKDIYGTLVGFPMVDHGPFVAGIVRSIDSQVKIECVRVLNDFGVGDTTTLINAFEDIQNRFINGTLNRAVVNLSLVATPSDDELGMSPYMLEREDMQSIREALYQSMASLASNYGVVFVASAGNDSDQRPGSMPSPTRFDARYPAAFAYNTDSGPAIPQVIPVGAVNSSEEASSFSNYPGPSGIAAYGGELPQPDPSAAQSNVLTSVVPGTVDALRGVYTAEYYPSLYHGDPVPPRVMPLPPPEDYPEYPVPDNHAWAYWAGTSFATPIITAIAARFAQQWMAGDPEVRDQVRAAATLQTTWDRLNSKDSSTGSAPGPLIMAVQCQSSPQVE